MNRDLRPLVEKLIENFSFVPSQYFHDEIFCALEDKLDLCFEFYKNGPYNKSIVVDTVEYEIYRQYYDDITRIIYGKHNYYKNNFYDKKSEEIIDFVEDYFEENYKLKLFIEK
jgi:hypothetical protein